MEWAVVPAHGSLPPKGEMPVAIRVTNGADQAISGTLQAVIATRLFTFAVDVPAKAAREVALKVPEGALPGRWQIVPLYVTFTTPQGFAAAGTPLYYNRALLTEKAPFKAVAQDFTGGPCTATNLCVTRTSKLVRVSFDWLDKTPVAAQSGFKNRYGVVIPAPLDLKLRGPQPSDAVELHFDLRPPESIGRPTADTDSNPEGVVRIGVYRQQDGDKWTVKALSLPEVKPERLKVTQENEKVIIDFAPETYETIGFSVRVTDRTAFGMNEAARYFTLTFKTGRGFEYMSFIHLAAGKENVFYRIGH